MIPTAPIDLAHLDRQTLGDRAVRDEVLDMFVGQTASLRAELGQSAGEARARIAHRVQGTALGIGAHAVAACARELQAHPDREEAAAALLERAEEAVRFIMAMRK
jgi:HPt (histidine-containing phosphotransfer) domain-containing protein